MYGSNSVRPDTRALFIQQRAQPPGKANDTLSSAPTANLLEEITTRLARLEQMEQENNDLKQQLQHMQVIKKSEGHDSSKTRQLLEEKQREIQKLRDRNASMAERSFSTNQRRTEDTLSTNRQSDLEREYKDELRDGRRVDAIDSIEARLVKDKKKGQPNGLVRLQAYRLACFIFEISYECALTAREDFISLYSSVLDTLVSEAPSISSPEKKYKKLSDLKSSKKSIVSEDSINEIMVLVKEKAVAHDLQTLSKTVRKQVKEKWKQHSKKVEFIPAFDKSMKKDLKAYIGYCTQFSWRIVTQVPPLRIGYRTGSFNPSYHTECQAFTSSSQERTPCRWVDSQEGKEINCIVWPTLYDWDKRVIEKGEVVFKSPSLRVTAV